MRDFPVFDTQNGVGSLILKEIPYSGNAYIHIQAASDPKAFLQECVDFCGVAGAEHIYAKGHELLTVYPIYTRVLEMTVDGEAIPDTDACLFPVSEKSANRWQQIYNAKMKNVPGSAYLSFADMRKLVQDGGGYFVHRKEELLGVGLAKDGEILAVASVVKGGGKDVVCALCQTMGAQRITLQVADNNEKAINLYRTLGFIQTREISCWYTVK